jgi:hypothetical protein
MKLATLLPSGCFIEKPVIGRTIGLAKTIRNHTAAQAYADLRTALSTSVLPSDQIAPGTL